MYPDLSYILHALFGTQPDNAFSVVKTFGLLLVISILLAAYLLSLELKRKEKEGLLKPTLTKVISGQAPTPYEVISNAILGFVLGFKALYIFSNFPEFQQDPAAVLLSMKGNWLAGIIGAALVGGLKYWDVKRQQLDKPAEKMVNIYPHERIGDITMLAALSGVFGAKLFAIIEDLDLVFSGQITLGEFFAQFLTGSGLAVYGGLIVAFITCYIYLKKKNIAPIHVMDAVAPALILSAGTGRLGCHFSGDGDWGIESDLAARPDFLSWSPDWLWTFDYPHNVLQRGIPIEGCTWNYCNVLETGVYPTSIYEFVVLSSIAGFLWAIRKRITIPGMLFSIYLIFNGFERFWIEKIRVNERDDILGFQTTQAEFISAILMIIGICGCIYLWRRSKTNPPVVPATDTRL